MLFRSFDKAVRYNSVFLSHGLVRGGVWALSSQFLSESRSNPHKSMKSRMPCSGIAKHQRQTYRLSVGSAIVFHSETNSYRRRTLYKKPSKSFKADTAEIGTESLSRLRTYANFVKMAFHDFPSRPA